MAKQDQRWPMWKIATAVVGLVAGAVLLFVLSTFVEEPEVPDNGSAGPPLLTVPTFLIMLGVGLSMLAALSIGWLIWRIRESRIPIWERKKPRRRKRRY